MGGVEYVSPFVCNMKNPSKEYPTAIIISAVLVAGAYILGTLSLLLVQSPYELKVSSGILDVIILSTARIGVSYIGNIVCLIISASGICVMVLIVLGVAKLFTDANGEKYIPRFLLKTNKQDSPVNMLIIQSIIMSAIIVVTNTMFPTIELLYSVLIITAGIFTSIIYAVSLIAYLKLRFIDNTKPKEGKFRVPGGKIGSIISIAIAGGTITAAMTIPLLSVFDKKFTLSYGLIMISFPIALAVMGWLLTKFARHNAN
jgi:amino acid transporter